MPACKAKSAARLKIHDQVIEISSDHQPEEEEDQDQEDEIDMFGGNSSAAPSPEAEGGGGIYVEGDGMMPAEPEEEAEGDEEFVDARTPGSARRRKLPVRSKDTLGAPPRYRKVEIEIPIPTRRPAEQQQQLSEEHSAVSIVQIREEHHTVKTPLAAGTAGKKSHIRFNDDNGQDQDQEQEQFYTPLEAPPTYPFGGASSGVKPLNLPATIEEKTEKETEREVEKAEEMEDSDADEEDEDDGDAPEAVSTAQAAAETRKSMQTASKAAEKHSAALKRKRQERDALFKAQASARTQKRVRVEDEPSGDEKEDEASNSTPMKKQKVERAKDSTAKDPALLLPAEFLESDSEDDSADESGLDAAAGGKRRLNSKIVFDDDDDAPSKKKRRRGKKGKQGKQPQDVRVGSTVYRVLKGPGDAALAPKVKQHARSMREALLARGRKVERPAAAGRPGAFFVRGR